MLKSIKEAKIGTRVYNIMKDGDGKSWLHVNHPESHAQERHDSILLPYEDVLEAIKMGSEVRLLLSAGVTRLFTIQTEDGGLELMAATYPLVNVSTRTVNPSDYFTALKARYEHALKECSMCGVYIDPSKTVEDLDPNGLCTAAVHAVLTIPKLLPGIIGGE